jgi:tetratricopeptide (TPR) repeat protein
MAARQLLELADAHALHTQALDIQRRVGTPAEQALCLNNLGVVAFFGGNLDAARRYHQQALALREQAGDIRGQASSLNNLGQVSRSAGDLAAARDFMEQGLALRRQLGDRWGVAGSQVNLAAVYTRLSDLSVARGHLHEALAGFHAVGDPLGVCECLEAGAELAHAEGRLIDAVTFLSSATLRREDLPAPRSSPLERAVTELLAELRVALGEEAYRVAWREGYEAGDAVPERLA